MFSYVSQETSNYVWLFNCSLCFAMLAYFQLCFASRKIYVFLGGLRVADWLVRHGRCLRPSGICSVTPMVSLPVEKLAEPSKTQNQIQANSMGNSWHESPKHHLSACFCNAGWPKTSKHNMYQNASNMDNSQSFVSYGSQESSSILIAKCVSDFKLARDVYN